MITRPVLRWFGGKWRLAEWIISNMPEHRIYVEPFGGAASVLLRKPRSYSEVYNDLDDAVYNVFVCLQRECSARELRSALEVTPFSRREFELAHTYSPNPVENARRTIVRSFMGFGGDSASNREAKTGFRSNSNRSGTTPAHDWVNYVPQIEYFHKRMRGVIIENRDYQSLCKEHDGPNTLFYFDPPYVLESRERKRGYLHDFTDKDQENFLEFIHTLRGAIMISGYETELYDSSLKGWTKKTRQAQADGAAKRVEALWMNRNIAQAEFFK